MIIPLNIFARLSLTASDGQNISVQADGRIIRIAMPGFWKSHALLKTQFPRRDLRQQTLDRLHEQLITGDLAMEIWIANRLVAQLRPQSRPNVWSRLLGYGALELKIVPLLLSLWRR